MKEASLDGHASVILVDRGGCQFVLKALNIQKFGASYAIVADDKEGEDPNHLLMADNGKGMSVKIPTFLISKKDGIAIKEAIH